MTAGGAQAEQYEHAAVGLELAAELGGAGHPLPDFVCDSVPAGNGAAPT